MKKEEGEENSIQHTCTYTRTATKLDVVLAIQRTYRSISHGGAVAFFRNSFSTSDTLALLHSSSVGRY